MIKQPKPDSKNYDVLIHDLEKGVIKIPKFQREFVWSIEKTAELLDSILKGYPIGTFILWETNERLNDVKDIGNLKLPDTPDGTKIEYVLDGQQRITSLFAAYRGAEITKVGEKKVSKYKDIVVNFDEGIDEEEDQIITAEPTGTKHLSLHDVMTFTASKAQKLNGDFTPEDVDKIERYRLAFQTYDFSTIILKKEDVASAIEVFTRINTGGQTLTLFEIMSAKTYDEKQNFDMQDKWNKFIIEVKDGEYDTISSTIILHLLSIVLSKTKECKRKTILNLSKQDIIDNWDKATSALKSAIEYFRTIYQIPASQILPYDALLVPFAYALYGEKGDLNADQRKYLEEFFWRMSLSFRYSSATESSLTQDVKRVDNILKGKRPDYSDIKVHLGSPESLIDTTFSAGNSYCKAVLCLLASMAPKNFRDNSLVILDNTYLKIATSKNYHHFFPKGYLGNKKIPNENSLMNITLVSDEDNKRRIRSRAPSDYIGKFAEDNPAINQALATHFIDLDGFGVKEDDYDLFLKSRADRIYNALKSKIDF